MRTRPELALILCEAAAVLLVLVLLVVAGIFAWPVYASLPVAARVLLTAAPAGVAVRLIVEAPHLRRGVRAWHGNAKARLLAAATNRRGRGGEITIVDPRNTPRWTPTATTGNGHEPRI